MKNFKNIHFIGIGGVGMSGLAELVYLLGVKVTGSDIARSENTDRLEKLCVKITFGHKKDNVENPDTVVYSSVIRPDNPEILESQSRNIPTISRADLLALMMSLKKSIGIAGSHGKTTTTSMLASILIKSDFDPTVVVGGRLNLIKSTARLGRGPWLIAEADESDGSFIKLSPEIAVITNIDNDHLDHYGSMDKLNEYMRKFAKKAKTSIVNTQNSNIFDGLENIITCGFEPESDYRLEKIPNKNWIYTAYKGQKKLFQFSACGDFNALNALMAIAVALEIEIDKDSVQNGISNFGGLDRRFEFKGEHKEILFYDDYAHHPTEIKSILSALKPSKKLVVAFQPHRYSRTQICWDEFTKSFDKADKFFLFDIYPASEFPIRGITSEKLFVDIQHKDKKYFKSFKDGASSIAKELEPGDIFLTLGAGDIYTIGDMVKGILCKQK